MPSTIIIFKTVLLMECDKEENVAVSGADTTSCVKKKFVKPIVQCYVFAQSPPGRSPSDKYPVNPSQRSRFV